MTLYFLMHNGTMHINELGAMGMQEFLSLKYLVFIEASSLYKLLENSKGNP